MIPLTLDKIFHRQRNVVRHPRRVPTQEKGILRALVRMSEIRDPYTAGHERRVAHLATAIGKRM